MLLLSLHFLFCQCRDVAMNVLTRISVCAEVMSCKQFLANAVCWCVETPGLL